MENSNAQIFKVKNAGIVLTTPFLPMFFLSVRIFSGFP